MASRYGKDHYEDVAKVLKENRAWAIKMDSSHARGAMAATIGTFADLFAADNPPTCHITIHRLLLDWPCSSLCTEGFDRDKFLAACGLDLEPDPGEDPDRIRDEERDQQMCEGT